MISSILKKFSGRHYGKYLKKCQPIIERINAIELEYQSLSDAQLRDKTAEFMKRNQEDGESLDDLLPEAFASSKERCPPDVWPVLRCLRPSITMGNGPL